MICKCSNDIFLLKDLRR